MSISERYKGNKAHQATALPGLCSHRQLFFVRRAALLLLALFFILVCTGLQPPAIAFAADNPALPAESGKENHAAGPDRGITWQTAHKGLEYGLIQAENSVLRVITIRINPDYYDFSLYMASEQGASLSLEDWAKQKQLLVAINASMYLPDKKTSIGYMRSPVHTNNPHIGKGLGAFFVASPQPEADDLPRADILEKTHPDLQTRLARYGICVQNYRLIDATGSILWKEKPEFHSITAIGKDSGGNILFFMARTPTTVAAFARTLQNALPDLGSVMYAEGGSKAAMYLNTPGKDLFWHGLHDPWAIFAPEDKLLPNVLGVKARPR